MSEKLGKGCLCKLRCVNLGIIDAYNAERCALYSVHVGFERNTGHVEHFGT